MKRPMRPLLALLVFVLLLAVSVGAAVAFGSQDVAFGDVFRVLGHRAGFGPAPDETVARIVWSLRLPRALLALVTGGGLALVGVAMQTLVRNPLAEPYILGISSGAGAGASVFYLGFLPAVLSQALSLSLAAFIGGLGTLALVYLVARSGPSVSVPRLLLAGIAMSSLMSAVSSFVTFASPDPQKLRIVLFWTMGSFSGARWELLPLPAFATGLGLVVLLVLARPLDALLVGEEPAFNLGVPVETTKRVLIVLAALVTGVLVAAAGAIGFVGLIVPHAARFFTGVSHRRLIPASFGAGALFLLWADLAARTLLPGQELPVGVLTALCGVPFFLFLLRRGRYRFA
jgi:iron complex transport system permease protein